MKNTLHLIVLLVFGAAVGNSQMTGFSPGVYEATDANVHHEIKVSNNYFIHTVFETSPPKFIKTVGGHYTMRSDSLHIQLEFNSNFANDSVRGLHFKYNITDGKLILNNSSDLVFAQLPKRAQDLDGAWLFATRGPDTGQKRRGDATPRKTLKFLMDGHFQWIAYHTETMRFSGTGGGSYTSADGVYTENIGFFSRDNARVGAVLNFNYELKDADWHHTGKNSKGEPMYEIWSRRE
ncbi:MAG: hypothetical protein HKN52_12495 [Eudoraea sp.]|nr:hypothetical protein [Muriicola sp.]NNE03968.1 hypothetical protein [Eudoraea sp.]